MNIKRWIGIIVFILALTTVSADPQINSFEIKKAYVEKIQFTFSVSDESGLFRIEILQDDNLVYEKDLSGFAYADTYQINDDGAAHTYQLIAYDNSNNSIIFEKVFGSDFDPPKVTAITPDISNTFEFEFRTNEPAICGIGLDIDEIEIINSEYETRYNITLAFNGGSNNIYIKCSDESGNEMISFFITNYELDTSDPEKVSDITFNDKDGLEIVWDAAEDNNEIDHYNIYNSLDKIASVSTTGWKVSTEDDVFYISAVDVAGNEGEKSRI